MEDPPFTRIQAVSGPWDAATKPEQADLGTLRGAEDNFDAGIFR